MFFLFYWFHGYIQYVYTELLPHNTPSWKFAFKSAKSVCRWNMFLCKVEYSTGLITWLVFIMRLFVWALSKYSFYTHLYTKERLPQVGELLLWRTVNSLCEVEGHLTDLAPSWNSSYIFLHSAWCRQTYHDCKIQRQEELSSSLS